MPAFSLRAHQFGCARHPVFGRSHGTATSIVFSQASAYKQSPAVRP